MAWLTNHPRDGAWLEKLITQLKIVARIERGDKLFTESTLFHVEVATGGWTQPLRRALSGENRSRNLERVASTVHAMMDFIGEMPLPKEHELLLPRCINALKGAVDGLRNLCYSYEKDAAALAQIDTIIETINLFVESYD